MSLPWYKRWTMTRDYPLLRRVSLEAAAVFFFSDDLAHECGNDGLIARLDTPLTLNEIREELRIEAFSFGRAVKELLAVGLWEQEPDGSILVPPIGQIETYAQEPEVGSSGNGHADQGQGAPTDTGATEMAAIKPSRALKAGRRLSASPSASALRMRAKRAEQKATTEQKEAHKPPNNPKQIDEQIPNKSEHKSEQIPPSPHTPQPREEEPKLDVLEESSVLNAQTQTPAREAHKREQIKSEQTNESTDDAICSSVTNGRHNGAEPSRALAFNRWFVETGFELKAFDPAWAIMADKLVYDQSLEVAESILAAHGRETAEQLARRFLTAWGKKEIYGGDCSVEKFLKRIDWEAVSGVPRPEPRKSIPPTPPPRRIGSVKPQ